MTIKSILVATDLSAPEHVAVQRAWHLAGTHRASVTLMFMPASGQQVPANAASRLADAARQLEESLERRVKTTPVKAHKLQDLVQQARDADLVVLPHRRERSLAAFFRGQPVIRLLRSCNCPVLVTRPMRNARHLRTLIAVDFSPRSEALVRLAADFVPDSALEAFHALSTLEEAKLRSAEATEHAVRAFRERCLKHAKDRMLALTDSFDARRNRFFTAIGRGDPGRQTVIQQERSGADLVVLGKARASAWEDFLCGSVAQRVLSWGTSDVLLVPQPCVPATARAAARRIREDASPDTLRTVGRRAS